MIMYDLRPYAARINQLKGECDALAPAVASNPAVTMRWMIDGSNELVPTFIVLKVKQSEIRQLEIEALGILD
jgi:hypothetical protein